MGGKLENKSQHIHVIKFYLLIDQITIHVK